MTFNYEDRAARKHILNWIAPDGNEYSSLVTLAEAIALKKEFDDARISSRIIPSPSRSTLN